MVLRTISKFSTLLAVYVVSRGRLSSLLASLPLQEEFSAMREMYVTNGHGFVLVYSITSRATFNEIQRYYNQIVTLKDIDTNVRDSRDAFPPA